MGWAPCIPSGSRSASSLAWRCNSHALGLVIGASGAALCLVQKRRDRGEELTRPPSAPPLPSRMREREWTRGGIADARRGG